MQVSPANRFIPVDTFGGSTFRTVLVSLRPIVRRVEFGEVCQQGPRLVKGHPMTSTTPSYVG